MNRGGGLSDLKTKQDADETDDDDDDEEDEDGLYHCFCFGAWCDV